MIIQNTNIIGLFDTTTLKEYKSSHIYIADKNFDLKLSSTPSSIYEISIDNTLNSQSELNLSDSIINLISTTISLNIIYMNTESNNAIIENKKLPFLFNIDSFLGVTTIKVINLNFSINKDIVSFAIQLLFIKDTDDIKPKQLVIPSDSEIEIYDSTYDFI